MQTFNNYWQSLSPGQKLSLAASANTSVSYLSQVANGHRLSGASLIGRLVAADENISSQMLRPDLFACRHQSDGIVNTDTK